MESNSHANITLGRKAESTLRKAESGAVNLSRPHTILIKYKIPHNKLIFFNLVIFSLLNHYWRPNKTNALISLVYLNPFMKHIWNCSFEQLSFVWFISLMNTNDKHSKETVIWVVMSAETWIQIYIKFSLNLNGLPF
jgi:hypothetical protein